MKKVLKEDAVTRLGRSNHRSLDVKTSITSVMCGDVRLCVNIDSGKRIRLIVMHSHNT